MLMHFQSNFKVDNFRITCKIYSKVNYKDTKKPFYWLLLNILIIIYPVSSMLSKQCMKLTEDKGVCQKYNTLLMQVIMRVYTLKACTCIQKTTFPKLQVTVSLSPSFLTCFQHMNIQIGKTFNISQKENRIIGVIYTKIVIKFTTKNPLKTIAIIMQKPVN